MAINFDSSATINTNSNLQLSISANGILKNTQPVFSGYFSSVTTNTTNYNPYLNTSGSRNVVVNATNSSITVPSSGRYHIYCQQLINTPSTSSAYLCIRVNGTIIDHAYVGGSASTYDMVVGAVYQLSANDVISFYYLNTVSYSWAAPHSRVLLHLIG